MTTGTVSFKNSPALLIATDHGSEATILLHGAQVVSWKQRGEERLYLSDNANLAPGSAIRGGIPVCFPQFSTLGPLPMHGFVRNKVWRHVDTTSDFNGVTAILELSDTPETLSAWPHAFKVSLAVTLGADTLSVMLSVTNTGTSPLSFTTALHSYFRVADINAVAIDGLQGVRYQDKVANLANQTETREKITFSEHTDRIYYNAPADLTLHDGTRSLAIHAANMPDAVVWNPWLERAREIPDLPDDGFKTMVCIEAGCIGQPVTLNAGESWTGGQHLKG